MKNVILLIILLVGTSRLIGQELNYDYAAKLARVPIECIKVEYPNKLNQVLGDSSELLSPSELHPIFYGCFDWHSSVHGHWLLARLMNKYPETELAAEIANLFDEQFTTRKAQIELLYFQPKHNQSFERTYGWAWILKLYAELHQSPLNQERGWTNNLASLKDQIVQFYQSFLPKLVYPIRVGEHTNTAFGLSLSLDYARVVGDKDFENLILSRAKDFYLDDQNCPINWEPSGFDFISPCLQEADLMSKVLDGKSYKRWLQGFLPQIFEENWDLAPGKVVDRTDGKLVHLDGLNFSRAWCLYHMAKALPKFGGQWIEIADNHVEASMEHVIGADYMGSHWLASFLLYALEAKNELSDQE